VVARSFPYRGHGSGQREEAVQVREVSKGRGWKEPQEFLGERG